MAVRRRWAIGVVLAAASLALAACSSAGTSSADQGFVAGDGSIVVLAPDDRQPAPAIAGTTLDGSTVDLADHLGDVVVLNVWASWCAPCRAEAPTLQELSQELADDGVQFVGLNTRDSEASADGFVKSFGVTYPSIVDQDGRLQLRFGDSLPPQAIPSTVVVDREGRVAARALGKVSDASLRGIIESILAERSG